MDLEMQGRRSADRSWRWIFPQTSSEDCAARHCERVAYYALAVAAELGLSETEKQHLRSAAMLHDLGKIRISPRNFNLLGRLTDEDIDVMRRHASITLQILERIDELKEALPAIAYHHERFDGQGPEGLAGQAIPLGARIICVAEAYDVLTTDVPWRNAMSHDQAIAELRRCAGATFDPDILAAFERSFSRLHKAAA